MRIEDLPNEKDRAAMRRANQTISIQDLPARATRPRQKAHLDKWEYYGFDTNYALTKEDHADVNP